MTGDTTGGVAGNDTDDITEDTNTYYIDQEDNVDMAGMEMWLEAEWSNAIVTLDANGGTINNKPTDVIGVQENIAYGTALKDAKRDGYVFAGWHTEATGGTQIVDTDDYHESDLIENTLYAHWDNINIATITYNANEGTIKDKNKQDVEVMKVEKVIGKKIGTMPKAKAAGRRFDGWFTEKVGGTKVVSSTQVTGNMTLYAHWFQVYLELEGGELKTKFEYWNLEQKDNEDTEKFWKRQEKCEANYDKYFGNWTATDYPGHVAPNRSGQLFSWKTGTGGDPGNRPLPVGYGTYWYWSGWKRVWTKRVRWIEKEADSGKGYVNKDGEWVPLMAKFCGWYTQPNGQGRKITNETKWYDSYGDTLYAYWKERYYITYDANGGHFNDADCSTELQWTALDGAVYPRGKTPVGENGEKFAGWYDEPGDGGNLVKVNNKNYLVNGDRTTLYAHWNYPSTITYDANGGSWKTEGISIKEKLAFNNQKYPPISVPTRADGYFFDGWYTAKTGGNKVTLGNTNFRVNGDSTLYAQWTEIKTPEIQIVNTYTKGIRIKLKGVEVNPSDVKYSYYINETAKLSSTQELAYTFGKLDSDTEYTIKVIAEYKGKKFSTQKTAKTKKEAETKVLYLYKDGVVTYPDIGNYVFHKISGTSKYNAAGAKYSDSDGVLYLKAQGKYGSYYGGVYVDFAQNLEMDYCSAIHFKTTYSIPSDSDAWRMAMYYGFSKDRTVKKVAGSATDAILTHEVYGQIKDTPQFQVIACSGNKISTATISEIWITYE